MQICTELSLPQNEKKAREIVQWSWASYPVTAALTGLLGYAVVDLVNIHAQRAIIVEQESVEADDRAHRQLLDVEQLRAGVHVDDHSAGVGEQAGLTGLHREIGDQVVGGKRDRIGRKVAFAAASGDDAVDRLRHERDRCGWNISGTALYRESVSGKGNILARDQVGGSENRGEWKTLEVRQAGRDLGNAGIEAERDEAD